jgi:hypothetical protein
MFHFLDDFETNPNHDISNEVKCNTIEIQQLREDIQLNTQILQEIKELVYQIRKDQSRKDPPIIETTIQEPIKKQKLVSKKPKAEIYTITTLSTMHLLNEEQAKTTETLAICFSNLFLRQKSTNACFIVCIFFHWLCCFDWGLLNEDFLNASFSLLSSLNIVKNTIPTQELWKPIKNFVAHNSQPNHESMWLPDIPEVYNNQCSIGIVCEQIYFLDFIRNKETQKEPISEWCFTYLCVCVFESGSHIRDISRLTLLSFIRTSERIPSDVFDNEVVLNLLKQKISNSPEDVVVSLFLNILFKLHKYRSWSNFFQTYTNVLNMLELIPLLVKTKENRKLVKFRMVIQKLRKADF